MRVAAAGGAYAPLAIEMRHVLSAQAGVRIVDAVDAGVPTLTLSEEHVESQVLAIDVTGKVSDYLLNYRVQYSLADGQGRELISVESVKLQREYTFDKLSVLAKEKEEEFLRREMQRDAVQQILRRLASLPPAGAR
ncbi:MAG TPA: LPS assembly lipoprotein LptE [Acidiferrobacterales bacterium]